MASTLSGPNVEEEHMWAVTLSGTKREYEWAPEDPSDNVDANGETDDPEDEDFDPACKPNHRLLIKSAILHPDAKKDEVTMLQVETTGYKKEKVVTPFLAMQKEQGLQQYVNLLLPDAAKIKIISGEGPVTLVGSHCVDFYDYRNYGAELDDEEEAESSEDDEVDEIDEEMEEQETTAEVKEDKSEDKAKSKNKASKMAVEAETEPKEIKKKTPKKGTQSEENKSEVSDKTPKSEDGGSGKKKRKSAGAEPMQESPDKKSPGKKRKASGDAEDTKKKRKGSSEK